MTYSWNKTHHILQTFFVSVEEAWLVFVIYRLINVLMYQKLKKITFCIILSRITTIMKNQCMLTNSLSFRRYLLENHFSFFVLNDGRPSCDDYTTVTKCRMLTKRFEQFSPLTCEFSQVFFSSSANLIFFLLSDDRG